jgi:hypothetical protein
MRRRRPIPTASLVAVIAALGFVATDRAPAAEPHIADMQVISSDANARLVTLGIDKSVVIDLPMDIRDALVGNPDIVHAVVRSKRRVYITAGAKAGQTNVYFFDATGRQIGGLDIAVTEDPSTAPLPTGPLENSGLPAKMIDVVSGVDGNFNPRIQLLKCAPTCVGTKLPPPDLPIQRSSNTSTSTSTGTSINTNISRP